MADHILEVKNLTKKFGSFTAVDNISFSLKEGEILGFLGPNGAGKTTTIQMLLGALSPTSGDVHYFGKELFKNRETVLEYVNFSSTYTNLPWNMTVWENLMYCSYLYAIKNRRKRVEKIIEIFKLEELRKQQMGTLSAGQRTRANLAKAFLNYPKVLLLDEPTASLDPDIAKYIRDFLMEQRKEFTVSIIITSHNMAEVEEMCDRVLFINHGKLMADDTPENLAKTIEWCHIELYLQKDMEKLMSYCAKKEMKYTAEKKRITIDIRESNIAEFLKDLSDLKIIYEEISIDKPTLEDYFLERAFANETA